MHNVRPPIAPTTPPKGPGSGGGPLQWGWVVAVVVIGVAIGSWLVWG